VKLSESLDVLCFRYIASCRLLVRCKPYPVLSFHEIAIVASGDYTINEALTAERIMLVNVQWLS